MVMVERLARLAVACIFACAFAAASPPLCAEDAPAQSESSRPSTEPAKVPIQGHYRLEIGLGRPIFDSTTEHYTDLYGKPSMYPELALDRSFFDWYGTVGLGARIGFYKDTGVAGDGHDKDNFVRDENSDSELTLIPLQAVVTARFTPFTKRWVVISVWGGPEYLYVQETRNPVKSSGATTTGDSVYVNSGWNPGIVTGLGLSFRLDPLDEMSVGSLRIIGFRSIYITPFLEVVTSKKKTGQFSRKNAGILFTFESML